jgi:signal transduction histidine kinase
MWGPVSWQRVVRFHPYVLDAAVAASLFAASVTEPLLGPLAAERLTAGEIAFSAVVCAAVALRRRWPLPVLAVCSVGTALSIVFGVASNPSTLAVVIAVYTVAEATDRLTAIAAGTFTALILVAAAIWSSRGSWLGSEKVVLALWVGMATAVGDAVRSRRNYVTAVEERARRAEQNREEETRRQVAEDRLRIARDLHDVMAHHIALINVQAGVAGHVLRSNPTAAEEALGHVRRAGRTVLDELGTVLGVLRQTDDEPTAPTEPAPTLGRLQELVGSFHDAGLAVSWRLSGQTYPLPAAVDLAAYRLLQESLTNVHKHGGAAARIRLTYRPGELVIEVENDPAPGRPPALAAAGTGHGLLGMRERVTAIGGTMHAGPRLDGGFRVRAVLPVAGKNP